MIQKKYRKFAILIIATLTGILLPTPSNAHASIQLYGQKAYQGQSATVFVRIPHGCQGKPVDKVSIKVPSGFQSAKPFYMQGWVNEVVKDSNNAVTEMTWKNGSFEDGLIVDFGFQVKLPSNPGTYYLPVVQYCGELSESWVELPSTSGEKLSYPAPKLEVLAMPSSNIGEVIMEENEIVSKFPLSYRNKNLKITDKEGNLITTLKLDRYGNGTLRASKTLMEKITMVKEIGSKVLLFQSNNKVLYTLDLHNPLGENGSEHGMTMGSGQGH